MDDEILEKYAEKRSILDRIAQKRPELNLLSDTSSLSNTELVQRNNAINDAFYEPDFVTIYVQNLAGTVFRLDHINKTRNVSYLKYKLAEIIPEYNINGITLGELDPSYPDGYKVLSDYDIVRNLKDTTYEPLRMFYQDSGISDAMEKSMNSTYDTYMNQFRRGGGSSGKKDKMRRSLKKLRRSLKKLLRSLPQ